jgi:hypothetical protein
VAPARRGGGVRMRPGGAAWRARADAAGTRGVAGRVQRPGDGVARAAHAAATWEGGPGLPHDGDVI